MVSSLEVLSICLNFLPPPCVVNRPSCPPWGMQVAELHVIAWSEVFCSLQLVHLSGQIFSLPCSHTFLNSRYNRWNHVDVGLLQCHVGINISDKHTVHIFSSKDSDSVSPVLRYRPTNSSGIKPRRSASISSRSRAPEISDEITAELCINDIDLCHTPSTASNILGYQIIPRKACVFMPCLVRHT